jgi:formamidopyrimidine-DNA glycosylase
LLIFIRIFMPEAPETYIVSRQLRNYVGQTLTKVTGDFKNKISNRYLPAVLRDVKVRGKQLVLCFSGGMYLAVHFMLTGQFREDEYAPNIRATFHFNTPLYFCDARKFAKFSWVDLLGLRKLLRGLGPSILNISRADYIDIIAGVTANRKIAEILHDQSLVSGVGNYLRAEALYIAHICPTAKNISRAEIGKIYDALDSVVKDVIRLGGTHDYADMHGNVGGYIYLIYGRTMTEKSERVYKVKIGSQNVYTTHTLEKIT